MALLSPCLANMVPKPQPTPPRKTRRNILQAYISSKDSAHNHSQNTNIYINMYRETHRKDSCMKGLGSARRRSWGSLTTHLQEVLPSCKGEQSLTFKRHQRSTVARWEGCQVHTLKIRPKPLADSSSITPMSEINRKVWTWNTKDSLLSLDYFTLKLDYRKPWPIAIFISENSSLLSKKYDFL